MQILTEEITALTFPTIIACSLKKHIKDRHKTIRYITNSLRSVDHK
jgi:hypothetical protein